MKKKRNDRILSILIKTNIVIIICLAILTAALLISKSFDRKPVKVKEGSDSDIAALINPDGKDDNEINDSNLQNDSLNNDSDFGDEDLLNSSNDNKDSDDINKDASISGDDRDDAEKKETGKDESDREETNTDESGKGETDIDDTDNDKEVPDNQTQNNPTVYADYDTEKQGWCFARKEDHVPSGTYEPFDISRFDGYFLNKNVSEDDPVIYLAFDCGYEYGYTPKILDTLAEHNTKAMFFVTGDFLDTNPELAKRMKEEGHMVGNHTDSHPSLPELSVEDVKNQILSCEKQFKEATGYDMDKFIRPPMGEYSELSMKVTQELGYTTIFWSMAYNDYDVNNQPGKDYVINHFKKYYHNGAITLTHSVSESNTEALDEVLTYLEEQGYRFGTLDELK